LACRISKAGRLKSETAVNCEEKMQKILISLLLAAAIPALAQAPKTKSETIKAEYCPMPSEKEECSKVEITRLIFAEPALTAFADSLLHDSLELKLANFSSSHVRKKLKKEVDETKDDDGKYLRLEQYADNALYGYSPDYLTIRTGYWAYGGGPHGNGGQYFSTIPRKGKIRELTMKDILLPGKRDALIRLVKEGVADDYVDGQKAENRQEVLEWLSPSFEKDYRKYDFNWTLDEGGLRFVFNSYSLGGYLDLADVTLPAEKLHGIIKPEILRQIGKFKKTAKD
jgi:hypothetical protein